MAGAKMAETPDESHPQRSKLLGQGLLRAGIGLGIAGGVAVGTTLIANAVTSPGSSQPGANLAAGASGSSGSSGSSSGSSGSSSGSSGTANGPAIGPGRGARFAGPGFGGPGGLGGPVIHGQYTIKGPNGYETIDERTGTVSSITDTSGSNWSLTVQSADGSSATFTVDSGTSVNGGETGISSVKHGDTVTVVAVDNNGTATAKQVVDRTVLQNNGNSWLPPAPQPPSSSSNSGTSSS